MSWPISDYVPTIEYERNGSCYLRWQGQRWGLIDINTQFSYDRYRDEAEVSLRMIHLPKVTGPTPKPDAAMKQIIVMRTDLKNTDGHKVRSGKLIAQGAHASMGAVMPYFILGDSESRERKCIDQWLSGSFTKICVRVDSEAELIQVHDRAVQAGLIACLITDNGTTEFGGVKTHTCCAIGPDTDEALRPITGGLKLL